MLVVVVVVVVVVVFVASFIISGATFDPNQTTNRKCYRINKSCTIGYLDDIVNLLAKVATRFFPPVVVWWIFVLVGSPVGRWRCLQVGA